MPALTDIQLKVDKWSKCTLVGAVLLFVYSVIILVVAAHAEEQRHFREQQQQGMSDFNRGVAAAGHHPYPHSHHRPDGPCRLHHFAMLGLLTSISGIVSSFKNSRRWVLAFIVLTLITEISALGFIGYQNAKAVNMCTAIATTERIQISGQSGELSNGVRIETINSVKVDVSVDQEFLRDCTQNVRHAAVLASFMVGVIACSLACCGSRFSGSLTEREEEEAMEQQQQQISSSSSCVVVTENNNSIKNVDTDSIMMAPVVAILVQQQKEQPQLVE